jgi:two-component system NtrC family sensor kinase
VTKRGGESFDRHDLRIFTVFANIAGAALQNAFLYRDLKDKMDELTATQQQLVHSTKMAAIGELAANVAHEVNNPLTSVLGYASHLLATLDLSAESRRKLQLVEQETLRVRRIIRSLLDFARPRPPRMQTGDLVQPIRDTVALLHGVAAGGNVRIFEDYPAAAVNVSMDQNELKQVFINIMNNALHAMPDGGTLTVRVSSAPGGEAFVEISDTGPGIAAEHRGRIFEPFFTTKTGSDGTGLGLSISERIIQNHQGRIELESEPGKGALFRVVLPGWRSAINA